MLSSQNCALEQACKPSSADAEPCSLQILSQFERFYQGRIAEIEANVKITDTQRNESKMKIMSDWIRDLGEQNTMLVQIVHDLEEATVERVKLLENKLQETSNLISHNMMNSDKPGEDLNALSGRICELVEEQDNMKTKIDFLHKDIDNLLEFIKRGRIENNWDLEGITFFAIQPSDIPAPEECTCGEDSIETHKILADEIAQNHDSLLILKNKIQLLEDELQYSKDVISFKDEIIQQLKNDIKTNNKKISGSVRKVRMTTESCQKFKDGTMENRSHATIEQLEELKNLIATKDNEITELKSICNKKCNVESANMIPSLVSSNDTQNELLSFLTDLACSMEEDKNIILNLQLEYETVLNDLKQTKNMYENDVALAYEKLEDIAHCIRDYRDKVINVDRNFNGIGDFLTIISNKIEFIEKLFQNKCEMCAKENVLSKIDDIITKVTSGVQTLSKIQGKKDSNSKSINKMIEKTHLFYKKNFVTDQEQQQVFSAIMQQFCMMEEFRICTVEVQAATEDLREEMSAIISNLNSRHCKYTDFAQTIFQVQDYLTRSREHICYAINRLELQDEEICRYNERIINNKSRLKDMKNEFNQFQLESSKYLNDVDSKMPKHNLLDYMKIHKCNNLLISVVDEVEQIVTNLGIFQSQGCCSLSTMSELKKQLAVMEQNIKEFKKNSDQILLDNDTAQNIFAVRFEKLEKYECEVDSCQTKMQDTLESIVNIRDQINEFECIKYCGDTSKCTNDTIKVKEDLRKLQKEYEEFKYKINKESFIGQQDNMHVVHQHNTIVDLEDQINLLQKEIKLKQEANIFFKQSIEHLEKELESVRVKFEEYRKSATTETMELRKIIFQLQNSVQSDVTCINEGSLNNKTDLNTEESEENTLKHELQNIPQLFKVLQDTIEIINISLREVGDKLKRLVINNFTVRNSSDDSLSVALELLTKHAKSINYCSFEVEKIKAAMYSKDKLMENMDEIIRIQKDSIMISQSEVENLHKTLQEKINVQEKMIFKCETEKRQLYKQVELQMQTIGHLQNAVVEAKRTIDQLTNNVAINVSEPRTPLSSTSFSHNNVHDV
ncbi:kinesin-related protein 4-like isoform X2 [Phymastichus coffea]|uniref:kinesin-related protein 4-like isoform X2 n=1 Tax=Phymastichus coffea TaxID=108790 RepID=UPI00273C5225|nr:kinesin-related protein 4-like isoform X2 [Phymastichus coffea]